ncbi:hypothetical protein COL8621_03135 [Actibacterium lipolyticum]|uniref:Uncharacterized protein n=1 Tax=Actibacterium lipolyticum TaxID=1524263 RepID=A0A238KUJ8_9RHOB|nr:hypothetical protein COL8621_03135 [Actibacterium lipolyticum]
MEIPIIIIMAVTFLAGQPAAVLHNVQSRLRHDRAVLILGCSWGRGARGVKIETMLFTRRTKTKSWMLWPAVASLKHDLITDVNLIKSRTRMRPG